jgi:acetyltransferase-like isoleucine patch superfamily enzyme
MRSCRRFPPSTRTERSSFSTATCRSSRPRRCARWWKRARAAALAILTQEIDNPKGYGRIVRDASGRVASIVEEKDASPAQRAIREVNTGIVAAPRELLEKWLARLGNDNAQGEYYLTDIVAAAVADGVPVEVRQPGAAHECLGVNSKTDLAALERLYQMNKAAQLLDSGVTLADPARIDIRGELTCGRDVTIDVNCIFEGRVSLGDRARIGANCILRDVEVGADTEVKPFSLLEEASIGRNARIGPYARIRPGTQLGDEVHIGNFVEVKASRIAARSKANPPCLRGRFDRRKRREHRRRHHHVQLRRRQQAPHRHRGRCAHRLRRSARGPGHRGQGRYHRRRRHDHQGRPAGRPHAHREEADLEGGLAAPAQVEVGDEAP